MMADTANDRGLRSFAARLTAVVLVAAVIRLVYALAIKGTSPLRGDEAYFHLTADWLSRGYGFTAAPHSGIPSALHPPLFSLVLVPASWLSSASSVVLQRATVALIGTAAVAVIGLVGRVVSGERTGLIAAGLAACIPVLWANDGVLLSESLTALLVALFLWACYRYLQDQQPKYALMMGLAAAAAALTRGELALLVVFAAAIPFLVRDNARRVRDASLVVVVAVLALTPWIAFNEQRFERPVLISSNLGGILCGANNRLVYSGPELGLWDRSACPVPASKPADQSVLSDFWTDKSLDFVREHTDRLVPVMAARFARMTGLYAPTQTAAFELDTGARPTTVSWLVFLAQFLLLPLAAIGAVLLHRGRRPIFPLVVLVAMTFAVGVVLLGEIRYRVTADVPLVLLAAAALDRVFFRSTDELAGSRQSDP